MKLLVIYPENRIKKITDTKTLFFKKVKDEALKETSDLKGEEKFDLTNKIYKKFNYNPIQEIILVMPYLVQVPIFLTMYYLFLDINNDIFLNVQFLFIEDLSKPDELFVYKNTVVNILPILMTLINIISIIVYKSTSKMLELLLPFIFLILLYNKPAALVLYWTFNNFLYLIFILYRRSQ